MKASKVISRKQLPTNLPLQFTAIVWLLLDRFDSPGWAWGVCGTVLALLWASAIHAMCGQEIVTLKGLE
jgi:hypothetical protein